MVRGGIKGLASQQSIYNQGKQEGWRDHRQMQQGLPLIRVAMGGVTENMARTTQIAQQRMDADIGQDAGKGAALTKAHT